MPSSRFHLILTTTLALLLGVTLSHLIWPATAVGYPTGTAVSSGSNPVVAQGGRLDYSGDEELLFTAPDDQDIVITDVVLSGANSDYDCRGQSRVTLTTSAGATLAQFAVDQRAQSYARTGVIEAHYDSGLPVPAGESVSIRTDGYYASCGSSHHFVEFSISGYRAQP